jgi:hypothetical protein
LLNEFKKFLEPKGGIAFMAKGIIEENEGYLKKDCWAILVLSWFGMATLFFHYPSWIHFFNYFLISSLVTAGVAVHYPRIASEIGNLLSENKELSSENDKLCAKITKLENEIPKKEVTMPL